MAADLDTPPPPVDDLRPATYDWSGFYVGAWAGATCIDGEFNDISAAAQYEMSGCGWKGGVMGGYNRQFSQWVMGFEADWGMSGDIATNEEPAADFAFSMDQIATFRVRTGYAIDDSLLYATGGLAWAQGNLDGIIAAVPDNINGSHWGWSLGGGIEQALAGNFRLRLEYLFTGFDGDNYQQACCNVDIPDFDDHEVKAGLVWAF